MRVAIIDIGSNAIRTVVYNENKLGSHEIYSEKFRSDIFSLLENFDSNIKNSTYNIFNYFEHIFNKLKVEKVYCVATEVLRNHSKAKDFIDEIKEKFNIDVKILSGEEEARYGAIGLISSMSDVNGISADLGGGSLELAEIRSKNIISVVSLPFGTKILSTQKIDETKYLKDVILEEFGNKECENLYLIGGALRLIGRCYMDYTHDIVKNLHNLVIEPERFSNFLSKLDQMQKFQKFFNKYKINKYGLLVLRSFIELFKPKNLIFSTFGLKEGIRFEFLPEEEKKKDFVFERCFSMSSEYLLDFNEKEYLKLYDSIVIDQSEFNKKIFLISIALSQNTKNIDRNYKDEAILSFLLSTDIPFDQLQRSMIIVALTTAFSCNKEIKIPKSVKRILNKQEYNFALIIGALIKICFLVDGPVMIEPSFSFELKDSFLEIKVKDILPKSTFEKIYLEVKKIGILRRTLYSSNLNDKELSKKMCDYGYI